MTGVLVLLLIVLAAGLVLAISQVFSATTARDQARVQAAAAVEEARNAFGRAAAAEHHARAAMHRAHQAESRAAMLAPYQAILDANAAAAEVRGRAMDAGRAIESQAKTTAEAITRAANQSVAEAHADAEKTRAETRRLEATVAALKNIVSGYGDAYILPTTGLLDELAEHFGHAEAGAKLKAARKATARMVKDGIAADCDYVELARRQIAIRFVVDAFNGKVDTVLADTRGDNFGTLAQKIRDAFALVNENGAAFRNARVRPEYLASRLEELKWAVIAHELRAQEREEQRALRERMRDEERAQKEMERALKDAEKEEAILRKAMEKARWEAEQGSEADRARYEAQLKALSDKLTAAEEKSRRAISMAQQTKAGNVYVISNVGSFGEHVFKIGMTRRLQPEDRVRELGDASVPFEFDIHAMIKTEDAPALECRLHKVFVANQVNKVNPRKEFFRVPLERIRQELEKLGMHASWTMTAASRQYQESLALERALAAGDPSAVEWQASQLKAIERLTVEAHKSEDELEAAQ